MEKTVYIVISTMDWDSGPDFDSIWSTKEAAEERVLYLLENWKEGDTFYVKEWLIDGVMPERMNEDA